MALRCALFENARGASMRIIASQYFFRKNWQEKRKLSIWPLMIVYESGIHYCNETFLKKSQNSPLTSKELFWKWVSSIEYYYHYNYYYYYYYYCYHFYFLSLSCHIWIYRALTKKVKLGLGLSDIPVPSIREHFCCLIIVNLWGKNRHGDLLTIIFIF